MTSCDVESLRRWRYVRRDRVEGWGGDGKKKLKIVQQFISSLRQKLSKILYHVWAHLHPPITPAFRSRLSLGTRIKHGPVPFSSMFSCHNTFLAAPKHLSLKVPAHTTFALARNFIYTGWRSMHRCRQFRTIGRRCIPR